MDDHVERVDWKQAKTDLAADDFDSGRPTAALRSPSLLTDIQLNGNEGIGNPEALKHHCASYWSRRITDEHRLVYKVLDQEVRIAFRYHYG